MRARGERGAGRPGRRARRSTSRSRPATTPTTRRRTSWAGTSPCSRVDGCTRTPATRPLRGRCRRRGRRRAVLAPVRGRSRIGRGREYGFPTVPGLLDAARRPFEATGLAVPWLARARQPRPLHPGHRAGRRRARRRGRRRLQGDRRCRTGWGAEEALDLLAGFEACDPAALDAILQAADAPGHRRSRRGGSPRAGEFVDAHFAAARPPARPRLHGRSLPYYRYDHGAVTLLVLDTVDQYGGWEGSLDRRAVRLAGAELAAADADQRYVVLASHHPLETLINADAGDDRVLGDECRAVLAGHPCVVLWLNGHTHETAVARARHVLAGRRAVADRLAAAGPHRRAAARPTASCGSRRRCSTTPARRRGTGSTDSIEALAGLSRELAANDWQWRSAPARTAPARRARRRPQRRAAARRSLGLSAARRAGSCGVVGAGPRKRIRIPQASRRQWRPARAEPDDGAARPAPRRRPGRRAAGTAGSRRGRWPGGRRRC